MAFREVYFGAALALFALVIIGVPSVELIKTIEKSAFPVVRDVSVNVDGRENGSIKISGLFRKVRDCNFEDLKWYRGERKGRAVGVRLEFLEKNKIRAPGVESFGPWIVHINREFGLEDTYADAIHQCRLFGFNMWWKTVSPFYN